jgi:hypothetical protein
MSEAIALAVASALGLPCGLRRYVAPLVPGHLGRSVSIKPWLFDH